MADEYSLEGPPDKVEEEISLEESNAEILTSETKPDADSNTIEGDGETPRVGMSFKSFEEVYEFYNQYARRVGFGTKIRRSFYSLEDGQLNKVMLTCCKEGRREYKNKERSTYRLRLSARTDCQARIKVQKKYVDGLFHLVEVNLEHNHPVNPTMSRFFRSHKELNDGVKKQLTLRMKGPKDSTFGDKEQDYSERNSLPSFLGKDDIEALHQFFVRMQSSNSYFFHLMDLDDGGRLKNVFWADGRSKVAYQYFGDIVAIDTTYLVENYETPLVTFVGINHHGHLVLLGCGLLSDNSTTNYKWLLKTWSSCMLGSSPDVIITNHCKAIQGAVAEVFPGARLQLCLWHIMKKMQENLGGLAEYKAIKGVLKKSVYESTRVEEFEEYWRHMLGQYGLEDNEWVKSLYEDRHNWAPVFVKSSFSAGMYSIEPKESRPLFFDHVHPKTSLKQFLSRYEIATQNSYEKELQADMESFQKSPQLTSKLYMEEQLRKIYTVDMFKKFQEEVKAILYCIPTLYRVDGPVSIFEVKECVRMKDGNEVNKSYEVTYSANEMDVGCSCCSFQSCGILCRHSLSVLNFLEVYEIPPQYILERWRKDFKHRHSLACSSNDAVANGQIERFDNLYKCSLKFIEIGAMSNSKYEHALRLIHEATEDLLLSNGAGGDMQHKIMSSEGQEHCGIVGEMMVGKRKTGSTSDDIHDLMQVRRRGRPPKKRKDSLAEKIVEASRKKVSQRKSMVDNHSDMLRIAPNPPHFDPHVWTQESINLTEQVSPTNLSIGSHFGVQVNHQHTIDSQAGIRWSFQQMFQQAHTPEAPPGPWAG